MAWYQWDGRELILNLRVQPRASRDQMVGPYGENAFKVRITAPPVDGKANQHLVRLFSKQFNVAASQVRLLAGESGRDKRIAIFAPQSIPHQFSGIMAVEHDLCESS
jgi:uncharacterized protein